MTGPRVDLRRLRDRLGSDCVTRYAPSPTGHLHLGHIVNAIYTWGVARALGGRVVLRLEDHDRQRCRPEFESSILADLAWLGLRSDDGLHQELSDGPSRFRQSDSASEYEHAVERLRHATRVFACDCSRREISRVSPVGTNEEAPYPGRCVNRGLEVGSGRALRAVLPAGRVDFEDGAFGRQEQSPADQVGALLLRDRLGQWTYQWAVCVDDIRHGVDLVVRGRDLLASTGRQIMVQRLLGRQTPPVYLHHPLIHRPDGLKLSKANRDAGIRDLRAAGRSPAEVFGLAAHAVGLVTEPRPVSPEEFPDLVREPS